MARLNEKGMLHVIAFVRRRLKSPQIMAGWYAKAEQSNGHLEASAQYTLSKRPEVLKLGSECFQPEGSE